MSFPAAAGRPTVVTDRTRSLVHAWPGARGRVCALWASALLVAAVLLLLGARPATAASGGPHLTARNSVLYAPGTGQTLYAAGADRPVAIASTTKLMTALIVLQHVRNLDTVFTEPNYYAAAADSQIGLAPGERMTVRDLLTALLLPSADDAAEDLAYNVGRGPGHATLPSAVAHFVAMMNAEAQALGLRGTHYTTPIGLDTPGNYSTASDLVRLAAYDMAHSPFFAHIVSLPRAVLHSGSQVREVLNRNDLVARFPWIDGVKTGHTLDAGYVLVTSARRGGLRLIDAVLGTSSEASRDENALALLDYGYATFREVAPLRAGAVLARPTVRYRSGRRAELIAASSLRRVVPRASAVHLQISAPRQLTGPLPRGAVLGSAVVLVGGRPVARVPLVLAKALPEISPLSIAADFIFRPLTLLAIVLLAGAGLAIAFHVRQRRRVRGKGDLEPA